MKTSIKDPEPAPTGSMLAPSSRRVPASLISALWLRVAAKKKLLIIGLLVLGVLWFPPQYGLTNVGQEFGTYGQYNRVLRLTREIEGYHVVNSQLSRKLDWRNLGHLESFSVRIRDTSGRTATVEFLRGAPEMKERHPQVLREIIKARFNAEDTRSDAGQSLR